MSTLNDLECYPEVQKYVLVNNLTGEEQIVLKSQLEQAFGDELSKVMSNRNPAWLVYEYAV